MSTENTSIRLGDEYDDVLKATLVAVLTSRGAVGAGSSWGVGGSQELDTARVKLGGAVITIESETYMGLMIEGPRSIVEALAQEVSEYLRSG
ncbi:hypothetical protein PMI36_06124 [Pseudomonas sp. GM79]|nr:hypothetical protein PMI36_06124 [Pseudomonas sp. GM79]